MQYVRIRAEAVRVIGQRREWRWGIVDAGKNGYEQGEGWNVEGREKRDEGLG
jgi:hypothetical protein